MNDLLSKMFREFCLTVEHQNNFDQLRAEFQNMLIGSLDRAFYGNQFQNLGLTPICLVDSCREVIQLLPQVPKELAPILEEPTPLTTEIKRQINQNLKLHSFQTQPFANAISKPDCSASLFMKALQHVNLKQWYQLTHQIREQPIHDLFYISTIEILLKHIENTLNLLNQNKLKKKHVIQEQKRCVNTLQKLRQRADVIREITTLLQQHAISFHSYRQLITRTPLKLEKLLAVALRVNDFDFFYEKKLLTPEYWQQMSNRPLQSIEQDLQHRQNLLLGIKHSLENQELTPEETKTFILKVIQSSNSDVLNQVKLPDPKTIQVKDKKDSQHKTFQENLKQKLAKKQSQPTNSEPLESTSSETESESLPATHEPISDVSTPQNEEASSKNDSPKPKQTEKAPIKIPQKYLQAMQDLLNPIREGIKNLDHIDTTGQDALNTLDAESVAFETSLTIAENHMHQIKSHFNNRQKFQQELTNFKKEAFEHVKGDTQIFALEHTLIAYQTPYQILPEELNHVKTTDTTFEEKDAWVNYIVHKYKFIHEAGLSDVNKSRFNAINFPIQSAILIFILGKILRGSPLFFEENDFAQLEENLPEPTIKNIKNARNLCTLLFKYGFSADLIKILIFSGIWSISDDQQKQVLEKLKAVFLKRYSKAADLPNLTDLNSNTLRDQLQSISQEILDNIDEHGITIHKKLTQISELEDEKFIKDILPYEWEYFKKSLLVTGYLLRIQNILHTVIDIENLLATNTDETSKESLSLICQKKVQSIAKLTDCDQRLELLLDASSNYFSTQGEFFNEGVNLHRQNTGFNF